MKRIYLDTSVIGSYLRDHPNKLTNFKGKENSSLRYYASIETIGELSVNKDFSSFTTQMKMLRELVSDDHFYHQPADLVRRDLDRFAKRPPRSLLIEREYIKGLCDLIEDIHSDNETQEFRQTHFTRGKYFLNWDRKAKENMFNTANLDGIPSTFEAFWGATSRDGVIERIIKDLGENHKINLTQAQISELYSNLPSYKSIFVHMVIQKLFPYSRMTRLCKSGRGDNNDLRQAVAGSYCDVFVTRDEDFLALLKAGEKILPYRISCPEDFLSGTTT